MKARVRHFESYVKQEPHPPGGGDIGRRGRGAGGGRGRASRRMPPGTAAREREAAILDLLRISRDPRRRGLWLFRVPPAQSRRGAISSVP